VEPADRKTVRDTAWEQWIESVGRKKPRTKSLLLASLLIGFQLGTSSTFSLGDIYAEISALVGRAFPFRVG